MDEHQPTIRPLPRMIWVLGLLLMTACGCSSASGRLVFRSQQSDHEYARHFSRAYFAQNPEGECDVVLIEDGIMPLRRRPAGPIQASTASPLQQVVHLRVQWRPLRGVKPDHPSATNAAIDWYVRANDAAGRGDYLHYRGAGFVSMYGGENEARFVIRSAELELTDQAGRLTDPLGRCSLSGSVLARRSDGHVAAALASVQVDTGTASGQAGFHEGPPPRAPTGP